MGGAFSLERVRGAVVFMIALVLSIAVHEFGHAITADRLGDRTPRRQGRVTLNPMAHADPIGTILFPLIGYFTGGFLFGWGRPVMVNPTAFTRRLRMKTAHLIVAAAGPAMNVVLAIVVSIIYLLALKLGILDARTGVAGNIQMLIYLNFILAGFNLIPVPPLDGGTVLAGILPDGYGHILGFLHRYGFMILMGLMITGILGFLMTPVTAFAAVWLNGLHALI